MPGHSAATELVSLFPWNIMKEVLSFWAFYFIRYSERRQHLGNWTRLLPEVMGDICAVEPELISVTGELSRERVHKCSAASSEPSGTESKRRGATFLLCHLFLLHTVD